MQITSKYVEYDVNQSLYIIIYKCFRIDWLTDWERRMLLVSETFGNNWKSKCKGKYRFLTNIYYWFFMSI